MSLCTVIIAVCIFGFKGASTSKVIGARKEMMMVDYDGQMIFGDLVGLKLPDIRLTGEENTEKTSPRKLVPTGDRTRARCVTSAHATTSSTAVDVVIANAVNLSSPILLQRYVFLRFRVESSSQLKAWLQEVQFK